MAEFLINIEQPLSVFVNSLLQSHTLQESEQYAAPTVGDSVIT